MWIQYYDWVKRYGKLNEHNANIPRDHWLTEHEQKAILDYHDRNPLEGYRRLSFMPKNRPRINPHQWMKWWNRRLIGVLEDLLDTPVTVSFADVIAMLTDPNTGRCPTRFSFVEGQL